MRACSTCIDFGNIAISFLFVIGTNAIISAQQSVAENFDEAISTARAQENDDLEIDSLIAIARRLGANDPARAFSVLQDAYGTAGGTQESVGRESLRYRIVLEMIRTDLRRATGFISAFPNRRQLRMGSDLKSELVDAAAVQLGKQGDSRPVIEFLDRSVRAGACLSREAMYALNANLKRNPSFSVDLATSLLAGCPEERAVAREIAVLVDSAERVFGIQSDLAKELLRKAVRAVNDRQFDLGSQEIQVGLFSINGKPVSVDGAAETLKLVVAAAAARMDQSFSREVYDGLKLTEPRYPAFGQMGNISHKATRYSIKLTPETEKSMGETENLIRVIRDAEQRTRQAPPLQALSVAQNAVTKEERFYGLMIVAGRTDVSAGDRGKALRSATGLAQDVSPRLAKLSSVTRMIGLLSEGIAEIDGATIVRIVDETLAGLCGTNGRQGALPGGQCVSSVNYFVKSTRSYWVENIARGDGASPIVKIRLLIPHD